MACTQTLQVLVVESGQEVGERKGERRLNPLIIPADVWAIGDNSTLTDCSSPPFQERCQRSQEQETWQSQASLFISVPCLLNFLSPTSEICRMTEFHRSEKLWYLRNQTELELCLSTCCCSFFWRHSPLYYVWCQSLMMWKTKCNYQKHKACLLQVHLTQILWNAQRMAFLMMLMSFFLASHLFIYFKIISSNFVPRF